MQSQTKTKLQLLGLDIYKTANSKYTVSYGGENFVFVNWQDVVSWIKAIREHETKSGFTRDKGGLRENN